MAQQHDSAVFPAPPAAWPVLTCEGAGVSIGGHAAVTDLSFSIGVGEAYGLLGPRGAGKTTTAALVCGLLEPDEGHVTVAGRRMGPGSWAARKAVGYVPQDVAVYRDLSGRENLRFFGRLYGLRRRRLVERVEDCLVLMGLSDRAGDRVETYSAGMKRRLNIAVALLHEPALLVLDEPTVGVDAQSREVIVEGVAELTADRTAVLMTSRSMDDVRRLCDRVGILDGGQLIVEGTYRELVDAAGGTDRVTLTTDGDAAVLAAACAAVAGVKESTRTAGHVQVMAADGRRLLPALLLAAERAGVAVTRADVSEPDLGAVFLHLTGRALGD